MRYLKFVAVPVFGLALSAYGAVPANLYDFAAPELYPIDNSVGLLHAADLTGSGRKDLIFMEKGNIVHN